MSDKHLRKEVKTFVSDLRGTEHGPISPEVRSRLVSTAGNWDASGADKYIERSVSRAINQLHRSGNERGANRMKNGIAYLTTLWTRLLGL